MAFGGMAPTTKLGVKSAKELEGSPWERGLVDTACGLLVKEFHLPADVPGAMVRWVLVYGYTFIHQSLVNIFVAGTARALS